MTWRSRRCNRNRRGKLGTDAEALSPARGVDEVAGAGITDEAGCWAEGGERRPAGDADCYSPCCWRLKGVLCPDGFCWPDRHDDGGAADGYRG